MYNGPLGQPNSVKVEIDFLQNVVLPPMEINYHNPYKVKTKVRIMDIREIAAEKIRAMSDRVRYRDFYDFIMIVKKLKINIKETLNLVREKEVRQTISRDSILNNWQLAKKEKQNEFSKIYYLEELDDDEADKILAKLKFKEIKK